MAQESARWRLRKERGRHAEIKDPQVLIELWMRWYGLTPDMFTEQEHEDMKKVGQKLSHYCSNVAVRPGQIVLLVDYELDQIWGE